MGWSRGGKVKFFQQRKSHISKSLNALVKLSKKNGIAIDKKQVQKAKQKGFTVVFCCDMSRISTGIK